MASDSTTTVPDTPVFDRNCYLVLTNLIQAVAFGVFLFSLCNLKWQALSRWPFLVSEFLTVVIVCFFYVGNSRRFLRPLDIVDVLLPFLLGLWQCVAMLLLGMVPRDAQWWFLCYFCFTTCGFALLVKTGTKTSLATMVFLIKTHGVVNIVQLGLLLLAIVACYQDWHVELIGVLFMVERVVVFGAAYVFDVRSRGALEQVEAESGSIL
jgi:hypothetical protein